MMKPLSALIPLTAASLLCAACGDTQVRGVFHGALTSPTPVNVAIVKFSPQTLPIVPVPGFGCPIVQPFWTSFNLVIVVDTSDMFLHQVGFQFLDGSGVGRSPLIFTPNELLNTFGNTLIVGGTSRTFAFTPHFGCGMVTPHALTADVVLRDRNGTQQQLSTNVPMR